MRLHILQDEKIVNRTIQIFEEVFPHGNVFIISNNRNDEAPKYVTCNDRNVFYCNLNSNQVLEVIGDYSKYRCIIVHFLSHEAAHFINNLPANAPIVKWIEWGGDMYNDFLYYRGFPLYADDSILFRLNHPSIPVFLYKLFSKLYFKILERKGLKFKYKAVSRIQYFIPDSMYDEYPLFLSYYPEFKHLKYQDFFYYPIDYILGPGLIDETVQGSNIMVGNSCSLTNNHLYIFDIFNKKGISGKIVVPLSYNGNDQYREMVLNKGTELFGPAFSPLLDFMPLNEYNKVLLQSNAFVFGNFRQEAVGNILIALYIGGRVYLSEKNPLLRFYKSLGLVIFSTEEISEENIREKLEAKSIENNRKILKKLYSKDVMMKHIRNNFR